MECAELEAVVRACPGAVSRGGAWFLTDPAWTGERRAEAEQLFAQSDHEERAGLGWLGIPTGGTGGAVRFARHDEATLGAAVRGFQTHFGLGRVNAVDVLPAHHVSGLLARVRCASSGGEHLPWSWKRLEGGDRPPLPPRPDGWVVSLVPTQLQRLLAAPGGAAWLRSFRIVFLGGGPVWPVLADTAAAARIPVALSYGMTETAAMVAALHPEEFLAGARHSGRALPHARLAIGVDGAIAVAGDSLFRGFWPAWRTGEWFTTDDAGNLGADGGLTVTGRRDAVIITGGKKVQPERVEAALRAALGGSDVAVIGVPDPVWGEKLVACVPASVGPSARGMDIPSLAPHERPKRWVTVDPWPVNAQGKVNRAALRAAAGALDPGAAEPQPEPR